MQVGEGIKEAWDNDIYDISSDSDLELPEPSLFLQLKQTDRPVAATEPVPETPPELAKEDKAESESQDTRYIKEDLETKRAQLPVPEIKNKRKPLKPVDLMQKRTRQKGPTGFVILATGLSNSQTARLQKAVSQAPIKLGISVDLHMVIPDTTRQLPDYTHLVASVGKDGRASRTFKYLAGIASGAMVVRPEWLLDSIRKGCILDESLYAVAGDSAMPTCMLSSPVVRGALLSGFTVFVWDGRWDAGSAHTHGQLLSLIRTLGATVAKKVPRVIETSDGPDEQGEEVRDVRSNAGKVAAGVPAQYRGMFEMSVSRYRAVILVDHDAIRGAGAHAVLENIVQRTQALCPCRTKSWLFDCISANEVL
ncbi:hypothetical protein LPJ64_003447 [Coemansia asiatica]|uniref:BRCT domain-containing protein n=1 Tax=Coemansia asiatica TaxID=1052880 RepID=A0A9W7XHW6_9FUNG|nr:hypothetical protein LPJ64_003447 [Coemansia asiatica]